MGGFKYIYDKSSPHAWRMKVTVSMLQDMFAEYSSEFDEDIDFVVYAADDVYEADKIRQLLKKENIYAYSTVYGFDNVIAIPDYKFACSFIDGESYYGKAITKMREIGEEPYTIKKPFGRVI